MRILLVEDDPMIGASVQQGLRLDGYAVDWVRDGVQAETALSFTERGAASIPYELLLLDLGLPRQDGLTLLKRLRHAGSALPVLIISARDAVSERIKGLDSGADDYLVKPFDLDELLARVRALLRRPVSQNRAGPIQMGKLRVDLASHEIWLEDKLLALSPKEFALLRELLMHPGQPLSRGQLENRLYGWGEEVESNAVEVHIHSLRKKMGPGWVCNVRGVGYFLSLDLIGNGGIVPTGAGEGT